MTTFALGLVLVSALAHATWNLLAKRAGGSLAFTWLIQLIAALATTPLALGLLLWQQTSITLTDVGYMLGSALLQVAYFYLLARGYEVGDLSLVYPLARGTGPLLATLGATLFLDERPSLVALGGSGLIALGVILLMGDPRALRASGAGRSVLYALLTGLTISAYTLWDKVAVTVAHIPPLLYFWGLSLGCAAFFFPLLRRAGGGVRQAWREQPGAAVAAGVLMPASYVLVLTALAISPVSYVAPAREIGILVGAVMGSRLLAEEGGPRRLAAAGAMVLGVVALAVG